MIDDDSFDLEEAKAHVVELAEASKSVSRIDHVLEVDEDEMPIKGLIIFSRFGDPAEVLDIDGSPSAVSI